VATFAQVWLVMVGAGVAMRRRQHVGIDIVIGYFPANVQRVAKATSFLLILWFLGVIIFGSFSLVAIGLILKSPALQIPMAVPYFALPIGMAYFLLEFAIATLPEIRDPAAAATVATGEPE
jgi:C4-dicarboxylate transporter DctQ subunit